MCHIQLGLVSLEAMYWILGQGMLTCRTYVHAAEEIFRNACNNTLLRHTTLLQRDSHPSYMIAFVQGTPAYNKTDTTTALILIASTTATASLMVMTCLKRQPKALEDTMASSRHHHQHHHYYHGGGHGKHALIFLTFRFAIVSLIIFNQCCSAIPALAQAVQR